MAHEHCYKKEKEKKTAQSHCRFSSVRRRATAIKDDGRCRQSTKMRPNLTHIRARDYLIARIVISFTAAVKPRKWKSPSFTRDRDRSILFTAGLLTPYDYVRSTDYDRDTGRRGSCVYFIAPC